MGQSRSDEQPFRRTFWVTGAACSSPFRHKMKPSVARPPVPTLISNGPLKGQPGQHRLPVGLHKGHPCPPTMHHAAPRRAARALSPICVHCSFAQRDHTAFATCIDDVRLRTYTANNETLTLQPVCATSTYTYSRLDGSPWPRYVRSVGRCCRMC